MYVATKTEIFSATGLLGARLNVCVSPATNKILSDNIHITLVLTCLNTTFE